MSEGSARAADIIAERRRAYGVAICECDADALAQFLDPELVIIASTGALRIGRDAAIANYTANEFRNPDFVGYDRVPDSIEIGPCGTLAVERGRWRACLRQVDGAIDGPSGLYQAGWISDGGTWRIRSEAYVRLSSTHPRASE